MRGIAAALLLLLTGCGGAFLPPPSPGRVCLYDLQGNIIPKGDCGCYYLVGSFTWKHYKMRECPRGKS